MWYAFVSPIQKCVMRVFGSWNEFQLTWYFRSNFHISLCMCVCKHILIEHSRLVDPRFCSLLGFEPNSWLHMHKLDIMTLVACHSIGAPIPIICCNLQVLSSTTFKVVVIYLSIWLLQVCACLIHIVDLLSLTY